MVGSWDQTKFPRLLPPKFKITSPASEDYNCIAWAVGDTDSWWWPDNFFTSYWPRRVPRVVTLQAFIDAFRTVGFEVCQSGELEKGIEKIALFVNAQDRPTHAARQLPNGTWTSKMGGCEDIKHDDLECLKDPGYGQPVRFMQRKRN